MKASNYYLVFLNCEINYISEKDIIKATIERLHKSYYRNRCIKLSWNVALIKASPADDYFHSVEYYVAEAIHEQVEKLNSSIEDIKTFILPVKLTSIQNHISNFEKELKYISEKDDI